MLEEALYTYLTSQTALTALVATRIYPEVIPQNSALPAIAYQRVSTLPITSRDGGGELRQVRLQFDVLAPEVKTVWQVTTVLEGVLIGFKQAAAPRVDVVFLDNRSDLYESETRNYRVSVDALVWYFESFT